MASLLQRKTYQVILNGAEINNSELIFRRTTFPENIFNYNILYTALFLQKLFSPNFLIKYLTFYGTE